MSEIDERLKEANDWMRRPDSDESFSVADLERWLNSRPVTAFEDARATIAAQAAEIERLRAALEDPVAVHINMLRGVIAKPTLAQIIHLYGEDALRAALEGPQDRMAKPLEGK